jgi:hypothetical protein
MIVKETLHTVAYFVFCVKGALHNLGFKSIKIRMSTAPRETIIKYVNTSSDILKECIAEYRTLAEAAYGHAVDAGRLRDGWPE